MFEATFVSLRCTVNLSCFSSTIFEYNIALNFNLGTNSLSILSVRARKVILSISSSIKINLIWIEIIELILLI